MSIFTGLIIWTLAISSSAFGFTVAQEHIEVDIPVHWEMTRSSITTGAATESETFSESWQLIRERHQRLFLQSPRAKVEVHYFGSSDQLSKLPSSLAVDIDGIATLLGVEPEDPGQNKPPIILALNSPKLVPIEIAKNSTQQIQVHIRLN